MPDSDNQKKGPSPAIGQNSTSNVEPHPGSVLPTISLAVDPLAETLEPRRPTNDPLSQPASQFADYEILQEIARGGMGVVFKARHKRLNRLVALKMILAGQFASESEIKRFYSEAEAAARLEHSGIVPIYEVGQQGNQHFYAMAFIDGQSFQSLIQRGPLPAREAADLVAQVAEAVQFAHSKGIVHRDLKPHNILLDADGKPKVTDFGLAKRMDSADGLTNTGDVLGTPSYMAPEQAAGKTRELGPLVDVYSLGAVLYAALTGRPPFQAASLAEILRQVIEQEPVSPRMLNPSIPLDLDTICLKCLQKEPGRRYESAVAMQADLQRYLRGEPILARPVGQTERFTRWCRRNPIISALSGTVAILLLTVAVAASLAAMRMSRLANNEAIAKKQAQDKATDAQNSAAKEKNAKLEAQAATTREREAKLAVTAKSEEMRRFLSQQYVQRGTRALEAEDYSLGLLWFVKALEVDQGDAEKEPMHRLRIANTLKAMPKLMQVYQHDGYIEHAEPSPDGRRIVTASYDDTARIWDLESEATTGKVLRHAGYVYHACFSPDGKYVATASGDGTARVWSAETGEPVTKPLEHGWSVRHVAFSPDSRRLATACGSPNHLGALAVGVDPDRDAPHKPGLPVAAIWDIADQTALVLNKNDPETPYWITFDPPGKNVVTCRGRLDDVTVYDAANGEVKAGPWHHGEQVVQTSFDSTGEFVIARCREGNVRVWSVTQNGPHGERVKQYHDKHELLSPNELRLDGTIWNLTTGKELRRLPLHPIKDFAKPDGQSLLLLSLESGLRLAEVESQSRQHVGDAVETNPRAVRYLSPVLRVRSPVARILPGSRRVFAVSEDRRNVLVWDLASQLPQQAPIQRSGTINSACYSEDGTRIAMSCSMGGLDMSARVFDGATGKPVSPNLYGGRSQDKLGLDCHVAFNNDNSLLAVACDRQIKFYRTDNFTEVGPKIVTPATFGKRLSFVNDGRSLLVALNPAGEHTSFLVYDVRTRKLQIPEMKNGFRGNYLALDPKSPRFVTTNGSSEVKSWDLNSGQTKLFEKKHSYWLLEPTFSHDGRLLVTTGGDSKLIVWNPADLSAIHEVPLKNPGYSSTFSPNDHHLVVVTDGHLNIYDVHPMKLLTSQSIASPSAEGKKPVISPDGRWIIVPGDGEARMYSVPEGELLGPPLRGINHSFGVVLRHDGREFLTMTYAIAQQHLVEAELRDIPTLIRRAELQANCRINESGEPKFLTDAQLSERWYEIPREERRRLTATDIQIRAWNVREAYSASFSPSRPTQLASLNRVLADDPTDVNMLRARAYHRSEVTGEFDGSFDDFESIVAMGEGIPLDWQSYFAVYAKSVTAPATRLARIRAQLAKRSDDPHLWQLAGFWHQRLEQHDEALIAFEKSAACGAQGPIHLHLAEQQIMYQQWDAAGDSLKRAFDYDICDLGAWQVQVYLCLATKDHEGVKEAIARFFEYRGSSRHPAVSGQLAWLDAEYARLDLGRSKGFAERALQHAPQNPWLLTNLAAVHFRLGELESARQRLDQALKSDNKSSIWRTWLLLALVQYAQGAKEDALINLNLAREWRAKKPEKPTNDFDWMDHIDYDRLVAEAAPLIDPK